MIFSWQARKNEVKRNFGLSDSAAWYSAPDLFS